MESFFRFFEQYGVPPYVVFSTTVSLAIFALGFILNKANDLWTERRRLKSIRMFAFEYIKSLIAPIQRHSQHLNSLADVVGNPNTADFVYQDNGIRSNYLQSLPQLDLFRALLFGFGDKKRQRIFNFNNLLLILEYLERERELSLTHFNQMIKDFNKYLENWNSAVDPIMRKYEYWRAESERTGTWPAGDAFIIELDRAIGNWQRTGDRKDLVRMQKELIQPVHSIAVKYGSDPRALELINQTTKAFLAHSNRVKLATAMNNYYLTESSKLTDKANALRTILSDFDQN